MGCFFIRAGIRKCRGLGWRKIRKAFEMGAKHPPEGKRASLSRNQLTFDLNTNKVKKLIWFGQLLNILYDKMIKGTEGDIWKK